MVLISKQLYTGFVRILKTNETEKPGTDESSYIIRITGQICTMAANL